MAQMGRKVGKHYILLDFTDPDVMYQLFMNEVDIVVDGGIGGIIPSTIIDCTGPKPVVTREGLGAFSE